MYFVGDNLTDHNDNHRRYYTMTNISPSFCSPQSVVKTEVAKIVDDFHMDAFLANCDCRFESRNTVMLKVVVIFLICVIMVLVTYMAFLMCLDPMLRKQRFQTFYRQQNEEMEENIFARAVESSFSETPVSSMRPISSNKQSRSFFIHFYALLSSANQWGLIFLCRNGMPEERKNKFCNIVPCGNKKLVPFADVLGRVEAEQNRWMKKVEEQRKNIFEDHTMLN
ncbi:unnamed protein product [Angiostrongylus costaricensis]|uniref:Uncharacterized protein n=1 Tax=Angiostrongylus costaricensis TaxID=334426 RepID=A0A0R3PR91_ANGCS|nr:unnamed protein product [Angiostrongylus costaricensis]